MITKKEWSERDIIDLVSAVIAETKSAPKEDLKIDRDFSERVFERFIQIQANSNLQLG